MRRQSGAGGTPTPDGFYFVLGRHHSNRINGDLPTLEILWVLANGAALWLLFRDAPPRRRVRF